jgi:CBS domain-containing protein
MIKNVEELLDHLYKQGKRKGVVSVEGTTSIQRAANTMLEENINLLAVTNSAGRYMGVISSADISDAVGQNRPNRDLTLAMTVLSKVVTVDPLDDIMTLAKKFDDNKIRHLIVADKYLNWHAVLSSNEVLKAVMANIAEEEQFESLKDHRQ